MGACCAGRTRQLPARLVVLSPSSVESPNVQDEITFALEEKKTVIPVFHRDCKVLLPGMKRLLEAVRRLFRSPRFGRNPIRR